jgi:hypothetical protein
MKNGSAAETPETGQAAKTRFSAAPLRYTGKRFVFKEKNGLSPFAPRRALCHPRNDTVFNPIFFFLPNS